MELRRILNSVNNNVLFHLRINAKYLIKKLKYNLQ